MPDYGPPSAYGAQRQAHFANMGKKMCPVCRGAGVTTAIQQQQRSHSTKQLEFTGWSLLCLACGGKGHL